MSRHLINRFTAVLMTAALLFSSVATVSAAVWTDQADYTPGSTVTISGDNSNDAGYLPGETVHVDVTGPNGYASSCDAVADESGAWSCQVTLDSDPDVAVGDYTYTATGETSGVTESGTFTDKTNTDLALVISPGSVAPGGGVNNITFTATLTTSTSVPISGASVTLSGPYSSAGCSPAIAGFYTANTSGSGEISTTGNSPVASGTYYYRARYDGDSTYNGKTDCEPLFVDTAPSVSSTTPATGASGVATNANIDITFSEAVHGTGAWYDISCGASGNHTATASGGPTTHTLDPDSDFTAGESCTVTIYGANVHDNDTIDGPDTMLANYVFSFTVEAVGLSPDTVIVTTEVQDADGLIGVLFALGAIVHDIVTVLTTGGSDIPGGSSVDFEFHTNGTCSSLSGSENVGLGPDPLSSPVSASSSTRGPLHAGDYSYKVFFNSGDTEAVLDGEADCEPFSVAMASTSMSTVVWGGSPPMSGPWFQNPIFDTATVDTDGYDGFDLDGTVTFTLYDNLTCDGTVLNTEPVAISGMPPQTVASTPQNLFAPGDYSFRAVYSGNSDYEGSTSDCEPFSVIPTVEVTRGTCTFDLKPDDLYPDWLGDQFRLIYTPWGVGYSKLNASNPGQMFVDIFFVNPPDYDGTGEAYLMMPFPFVTKGAMPVHFYDGVTITEPEPGKFCYEPGAGIPLPSDEMVALQDYVDAYTTPDFGDTVEMDFENVPVATISGLTLIRVHVDYGLKWNALNCYKDTENPGVPFVTARGCDVPWGPTDFVIPDNQPYEFAVTVGPGASDTIYSQNVFKKDPGIGGLVLDADGNPVAGTTVEIWQGTKLWKTVSTDEDGWYMATFKYTGKAVTFTVKLTDLGLEGTTTLKSNGYAILNFIGV